jgi:hypothetical protein
MYFKEIVEDNKGVEKKHIDFMTFAAAIVVITFVLAVIIVYGPKSPLFTF